MKIAALPHWHQWFLFRVQALACDNPIVQVPRLAQVSRKQRAYSVTLRLFTVLPRDAQVMLTAVLRGAAKLSRLV
jgi:hypothetical protein